MTHDTEASLSAELAAWCSKEKLPYWSADELIHEDITGEQRKYLSAFIVRWNAVVGGAR